MHHRLDPEAAVLGAAERQRHRRRPARSSPPGSRRWRPAHWQARAVQMHRQPVALAPPPPARRPRRRNRRVPRLGDVGQVETAPGCTPCTPPCPVRAIAASSAAGRHPGVRRRRPAPASRRRCRTPARRIRPPRHGPCGGRRPRPRADRGSPAPARWRRCRWRPDRPRPRAPRRSRRSRAAHPLHDRVVAVGHRIVRVGRDHRRDDLGGGTRAVVGGKEHQAPR